MGIKQAFRLKDYVISVLIDATEKNIRILQTVGFSRTRMRTVSCAFTFTKHRAGQHTKTETGDTEELNSEGNEKRRRQRESRVNSGVEKKSSDKH